MEGSHRSDVTLAMHHRLSDISTYRLNGLLNREKQHANNQVEYDTFTFNMD